MPLELPLTVDVIEAMENYIAAIRPPEEIRDKVDIAYKIDNQSIIIYEIRPVWHKPGKKVESGVAKATYVKSSGKWKLYWKRASGKWDRYDPDLEVDDIKKVIEIIMEDRHHCFWG